MNSIKALILDNEMENVELLKIHLKKYFKNIEIIYTATNLIDATSIYFEHEPNIFFLDIQLENNETSFTFIENIKNFKGEIIFISSYKEYALRAIKAEVFGYLLKPIQLAELVNITKKAIVKILNKKHLETSLNQSLESNVSFVAIPFLNKIDIINIEDIIYLEADGRYTIFHLKNETNKVASKNLGEYEKQLDSKIFFRIHHGYIVNLKMVTNINKSSGNYCELLNNKTLPIAKRRQDQLHRFLRIKK